MSKEIKDYLHRRGIATPHCTPHHWKLPVWPMQPNWKTVSQILKGRNLGLHLWERVLPSPLGADFVVVYSNKCRNPWEVLLVPSWVDVRSFPPSWMITRAIFYDLKILIISLYFSENMTSYDQRKMAQKVSKTYTVVWFEAIRKHAWTLGQQDHTVLGSALHFNQTTWFIYAFANIRRVPKWVQVAGSSLDLVI